VDSFPTNKHICQTLETDQVCIFASEDEVKKAIEEHEISTNTKFSVFSKDAGYRKEGN